MSEELRQLKREIVEVVQEQLTGFSHEVAANFKEIMAQSAAAKTERDELASQVSTLTSALETQNNSFTSAIESATKQNASFQTDLQKALEGRLGEYTDVAKKRHEEMSVRFGKLVDESNSGISAAVQSAAEPVLKKLGQRQDDVEGKVATLDGSLRRFDEQAGQMVAHINNVTEAIEGRLEKMPAEVGAGFEDRIGAMVLRIDEVSAAAARQQADVSNIVSTKVDSSEQRINERLAGAEGRLSDEIGQRVAEIDAHVGHISTGLDQTIATLNDRLAATDGRFSAVDAEFAQIREDLGELDSEAIDEMKDKISSALGQAELVRIEMERFQETVRENLEKMTMRLTEVETTVQDQSMDVESAVQLERLEEVERAVLMLDPDILDNRGDDMFTAVAAVSHDADDYSADGFPGEMTTVEHDPEPAMAVPATPEPTPEVAPEPVVESPAPMTAPPAPEPAVAAPAPEPVVAAPEAPAPADTGVDDLSIEMPSMPSLSELTGSASEPLSPPSAEPTDDATVAMPRPS